MRKTLSSLLVLALSMSLGSAVAAPKKAVKKPVAKAAVVAKPAVVNETSATDRELNLEELGIAHWVEEGTFACEEGGPITMTADTDSTGHFMLAHKGNHYRVSPRVSLTGAVRLENSAGSIVLLQLANKSMLLAPKQGSRLADGCMSETQKLVAAELAKAPAVSLFDDAPPPVAVLPHESSTQAAAQIMGD